MEAIIEAVEVDKKSIQTESRKDAGSYRAQYIQGVKYGVLDKQGNVIDNSYWELW
jgi:hypothetical protein